MKSNTYNPSVFSDFFDKIGVIGCLHKIPIQIQNNQFMNTAPNKQTEGKN